MEAAILKSFEEKYKQGNLLGWDQNAEYIDEDKA